MNKKSFLRISILFLILAIVNVRAQNISIQGYLTDGSGEKLSDGNYSIEFKIYNFETGGSALWTETQNLAVSDGIFNAELGAVTALSIDFDTQYWVGISIAGDAELSPRIKLTYSPYSMYAIAIADNSVNSSKIENGTIAGVDLSQMGATLGQVLKWNGLNWQPDNDQGSLGAFWEGTLNTTGDISRFGKVAIGTTLPLAMLHTSSSGLAGEGNVLFEGFFQSTEPGDPPISGAGTRMMWYPDKAAFRVGYVNNSNWDKNSIGSYSMGLGYSTKAIGDYSVALGYFTESEGNYSTSAGRTSKATGFVSTAFGDGTIASGAVSTAMGYLSTASGSRSVAIGDEVKASGTSSLSMGYRTTASGDFSTAMGDSSVASGNYSFAVGDRSKATGSLSIAMGLRAKALGLSSVAIGDGAEALGVRDISIGYGSSASGNESMAFGILSEATGIQSTALGGNVTASGNLSTAFGVESLSSGVRSITLGSDVTSKSGFEIVTGRWNSDYTPISTDSWDSNDRLFVVGNGTGTDARSNAMTILKNGRVGLQSVTAPTFALELPNNSDAGIGNGRAFGWITYSDGRIKSAIKEISYGLAEILQIKPLSYFQHNSKFSNENLVLSDKGSNNIGFIAQDLYEIIPELVTIPNDENSDLWSVSYDKLTPVLVKAVQEQQEIIDEQQNEIEKLKQEIEIIKQQINSINQ